MATKEASTWRWWPTVSEIAESMRPYIASGKSSGALRLLLDGLNYLPDAVEHDDLDRVLAPPTSTGDERWDTLLAAVTRIRLHHLDLPTPAWTFKPPLPKMWWPHAYTKAKAINDFNNTPVELRRVGIFLDKKGFEPWRTPGAN